MGARKVVAVAAMIVAEVAMAAEAGVSEMTAVGGRAVPEEEAEEDPQVEGERSSRRWCAHSIAPPASDAPRARVEVVQSAVQDR